MVAVLSAAQRQARHAANVAAGFTIACKHCANVYRKGWGTEDGFCSATCRELAVRSSLPARKAMS